MAYVAIKPCKLAGQSFKIGESVPAEVLQPGAAKNLVKMGIIADGEGGQTTAPKAAGTIKINIHAKEGDMPLEVTQEGLQAVFDVLTSSASDAEAIIEKITDEDALILLDVSDKRKAVGELTRARAEAMEGAENEGEL